MPVEIDVLGALRVRRAGRELPLGGRRERTVLAALAVAAGRQVSDERLVDEVWGDDPPASAIGSLQVAVSRLRKLLGDDAVLRREAAGYVLEGVALDADALSAAAARLDGGAHEVLATTEAALALWRGVPYADLLAAPTLRAEATRLDEDRLPAARGAGARVPRSRSARRRPRRARRGGRAAPVPRADVVVAGPRALSL